MPDAPTSIVVLFGAIGAVFFVLVMLAIASLARIDHHRSSTPSPQTSSHPPLLKV